MTPLRPAAVLALALILTLPLAPGAAAQDGPAEVSERIMADFVPDPARLEPITSDHMREHYPGRNYGGIYFLVQFDGEQRFVERFDDRRRTSYHASGESTPGIWSTHSGIICFRYPEDSGFNGGCFREYRYGDCVVAYGARTPLRDGLPADPSSWLAVLREVPDDFVWPDRPAAEQDAFTCRSLLS